MGLKPRSSAVDVRAAKSAVRSQVWDALRAAGAARFPGARGRIPNFVGAERAAERLTALPEWRAARAIKCNPDSPQRPIRRAALVAGKVLFMPAPRLAETRPFLRLDPAAIDPGDLWRASSIRGAFELGEPVTLDEVPAIDLIVTGCVAVTRQGARLGKGGGYSDLEYALLRQAGRVGERTPIVTSVHPSQIVPARAVRMTAHDISLDAIATPETVIRCTNRPVRPHGVLWNDLEMEKRDAIPVLRAMWRARGQQP